MRPSRNGGWRMDRYARSSGCKPLVSTTMIEKIIVVAPTTAVPMSTGFAVALNVLPAPSFSSSRCLARSKSTVTPCFALSSSLMLGSVSMTDSSNTDCALSVTGPYESTAIVTGPMPRNPNATSPKENTAGAIISDARPSVLTQYATAISATIVMPIQYALKLPATRPDRMLSEAPPSFEELSTSRTCADSVDVKILTSSGITAPASVPQLMMADSFHQSEPSPRSGIKKYDTTNVSTSETSDVSGASKLKRSECS